jgi:hypothetical protein
LKIIYISDYDQEKKNQFIIINNNNNKSKVDFVIVVMVEMVVQPSLIVNLKVVEPFFFWLK